MFVGLAEVDENGDFAGDEDEKRKLLEGMTNDDVLRNGELGVRCANVSAESFKEWLAASQTKQ